MRLRVARVCLQEALGIFVHDVHRRWGSVFWRSWARVIRGRLPAIGRPNAGILDHGPPPAYARGQAAVGGAEPWPRVQPSVLCGLRAAAGHRGKGRRAPRQDNALGSIHAAERHPRSLEG